MKSRDIILFLAFFGIFFALLNVNFSKKRQNLTLCNPTQVTDFRIQSKKKDVRGHLDADSGEWGLSTAGGDQAPGGTEAIKAITALACYLPYIEKFTLDSAHADEELQAFGLNNSSKRFTVAIDKTENILEIGNEAASGTEFYVRVLQEPNVVYTINNPHKVNLTASFLDLRSRLPFADLDQNERVTIHFGNSELSLKKGANGWGDEAQTLTVTQVEEIIKTLKSFCYTNYKGPVEGKDGLMKSEFIPYGLDFPDVTLELTNSKKPQIELLKLVKYSGFYHLTTQANHKTHLLVLRGEAPKDLFQILETLSTQTP